MVATALRQEVISYVDMLDEAQTQNVLIYVRNLAKPRNIYSDSRSPAERADAIKAFEELEKMDFHVKGETSLDGRKERTEALWRKYESLS